jgi:predicted HicB family RNase H-like nuclease
MNTMTYEGYTARVEYDDRDNFFIGRILGIRHIISFHCETVKPRFGSWGRTRGC